MTLRIGLTGGIGSGKTTVSSVFSVLGVPVFNADVVVRLLQEQDACLITSLKKHFGNEIYKEANSLDRALLASKVFGNPQALALLNSLVHPLVYATYERWLHQQKLAFYTIYEAALIFENNRQHVYDQMITVCASEAIRIERVQKRNGLSKEQITARMQTALSEAEKCRLADYIIYNNGLQAIIPQVLSIHSALLSLLKKV